MSTTATTSTAARVLRQLRHDPRTVALLLGLLCSAFARSEFQAVQFMPAVVLPQLLLCGLFVPRSDMASWLHGVSDVLPLTYAVDALSELAEHGSATGAMWRDLGVVAAVAAAAL